MSDKPVTLPDAQIIQQAVGQLPWHHQLVESLPTDLQSQLPSIEQIERELEGFSHE